MGFVRHLPSVRGSGQYSVFKHRFKRLGMGVLARVGVLAGVWVGNNGLVWGQQPANPPAPSTEKGCPWQIDYDDIENFCRCNAKNKWQQSSTLPTYLQSLGCQFNQVDNLQKECIKECAKLKTEAGEKVKSNEEAKREQSRAEADKEAAGYAKDADKEASKSACDNLRDERCRKTQAKVNDTKAVLKYGLDVGTAAINAAGPANVAQPNTNFGQNMKAASNATRTAATREKIQMLANMAGSAYMMKASRDVGNQTKDLENVKVVCSIEEPQAAGATSASPPKPTLPQGCTSWGKCDCTAAYKYKKSAQSQYGDVKISYNSEASNNRNDTELAMQALWGSAPPVHPDNTNKIQSYLKNAWAQAQNMRDDTKTEAMNMMAQGIKQGITAASLSKLANEQAALAKEYNELPPGVDPAIGLGPSPTNTSPGDGAPPGPGGFPGPSDNPGPPPPANTPPPVIGPNGNNGPGPGGTNGRGPPIFGNGFGGANPGPGGSPGTGTEPGPGEGPGAGPGEEGFGTPFQFGKEGDLAFVPPTAKEAGGGAGGGGGGGSGGGLGGNSTTQAAAPEQEPQAQKPYEDKDGKYSGDGGGPGGRQGGGGSNSGIDLSSLLAKFLPQEEKPGNSILEYNNRAPAGEGGAGDDGSLLGKDQNLFERVHIFYQRKHKEGQVKI